MILAAGVIAEKKLTLIEELWQYFYYTYFTDRNVYENINVNSGVVSIKSIIIGLSLGLALAAFFAVFNKKILGRFVRTLIKNECFSPESAKTLGELGFADKLLVRGSLRRGVTLKRVVRSPEEDEFLAEEEKRRAEYEKKRAEDSSLPKYKEKSFIPSLDTDRFYIPEEMRYMADIKFDDRGSSWYGVIATLILSLVVIACLLIAVPYILSLVDDLVGAFRSI